MTPAVEVLCVAVLALAVFLRARGPAVVRAGERAVGIGLGAVLTEHSCIAAYGFYGYDAGWHGWAGHVPLLVAAIWVVVVLSADDIAAAIRQPARSQVGHAALVGALVVADASLVEPIATHVGLWTWSEPGVFGVPWIGILGWGYFAGATTFWGRALAPAAAEPTPSHAGAAHALQATGVRAVAVALASTATTHVLLLATWWGGLRWLGRGAAPVDGVAGTAWALAAVAVVTIVGRGVGVPVSLLAPRLAPAAFFLGLLVAVPAGHALSWYALAFVPPWVALAAGGVHRGRRFR